MEDTQTIKKEEDQGRPEITSRRDEYTLQYWVKLRKTVTCMNVLEVVTDKSFVYASKKSKGGSPKKDDLSSAGKSAQKHHSKPSRPSKTHAKDSRIGMETKGNVGKASKEVTQHLKSRNISSEEEEDETSLLKKISMKETDAEILNPLVKSGPFNEKERGTEPRIKYPPTKKVKFSLANVDDSSSKETDNQSAEHEPILTSPCQQQTVLSTQQPAKSSQAI
ncbi:hypothetical protein DAPPUDRAFT_325831 [Daphnia pulex]|uniref:Uncharacterized protein n=1 Tax=Daphnia pulex TaxID=6669 RepID=E9H5X1_DAPPU|nr:hypothetical protein DAPPUDRAFT_325831 [Daphnia pulex]|eukprot:EFX72863.1 hypothetical protein DAPPUDRAFT_325831 [Daphnia pulex]